MTKEDFRCLCLSRLRTAASRSRFGKDKRLNFRLGRRLAKARGRRILLYWPLASEPDIRPLLHALRRRGAEVCLPFMEGASFRVVPFRYPLKRKRFGIFEPGNSLKTIKTIDIAVVPAVGVDAQARRIGFGKGMYDRFFAALKKKPLTIFVQLERCVTNEKICDHYDVSADVLLTPSSCEVATRMSNDQRTDLRRCNRRD